LIGSVVAIFIALSLSWFAMTLLFARHVERRVENDLRREATQVVAGITLAKDGGFDIVRAPTDSRFATPASGLYWQASMGQTVHRSRSLWDQELDRGGPAAGNAWSLRLAHGPFEKRVLIVERLVRPDPRAAPVLVQVGQDNLALHVSQVEFGKELALFLALLWLVLSAAAWLQVGVGLRAFARLRSDVMQVKRHPGERLSSHYPAEVAPLIEAINDLAQAREDDVRRARQRAADLAHAMKTPIAALSAQSRQLAGGSNGSTQGLDRAIASVAAAVEAELARARAAASRSVARSAVADPATVARRLVAVLERTDKGMRTDFIVDFEDGFKLRVDEADLTEILGALVENATHFARRTVLISGKAIGEGGAIRIEDDGPGLDPDEAARVLARGIRLDERSGGHGLGMSIARELTEATEGELTLGRAELGGLCAELRWHS
jgi:signal transduction histidine kinase